jgi:hypothetical protein
MKTARILYSVGGLLIIWNLIVICLVFDEWEKNVFSVEVTLLLKLKASIGTCILLPIGLILLCFGKIIANRENKRNVHKLLGSLHKSTLCTSYIKSLFCGVTSIP